MKAGGRERRGALCKIRSPVTVRVSGKNKRVPPVRLLNGDGTTTIILIMLLSILPYWASLLSPLPVGLGCSPKPALGWCSPFKFFHTSSFTDTWPHSIKKKPSHFPFALSFFNHFVCALAVTPKSPCSEMLNFLLTDSRDNSHWFTKLCFENQCLKWLVSVN